MRRIYKFPLAIVPEQRVVMAPPVTPLSVQMQNGQLVMWCIVEDRNPPKPHRVYVVGTGHAADHVVEARHVGTVQDGPMVWHVFVDRLAMHGRDLAENA